MNNFQFLRPFSRFCYSIGYLPTVYKDALSYEEQLLWLCRYLETEILPTVNNNASATKEVQDKLIELKDYVDNYFTSLDVQEEINNKLDEMVTDGSLVELISSFTQISELIDTKVWGQITPQNLDLSEHNLQGMAIGNNKLVVAATNGDDVNTGKLIMYSMITGEILITKENLSIGHGNGITYCTKDNCFYVAVHDTGLNKIVVYDEDLEYVKEISFDDLEFNSPFGIAYNEVLDVFYVIVGGGILVKMNYELNQVISYKSTINHPSSDNIVGQSIFSDGKYIYFIYDVVSSHNQYYRYNYVDCYNLQLDYIKTSKITASGEIESGCYYNGEYYLLKISNHKGIIFKANFNNSYEKFEYIDNNLLEKNTFPFNQITQSCHVNSNYYSLFCDGSSSKPFNHLWQALTDGLSNFGTNVALYLSGDFSNYDITIRGFSGTFSIYSETSGTRIKVGGINGVNTAYLNVHDVEIVKPASANNSLINLDNVSHAFLTNILLSGNGSENYGIYANNSFVEITNSSITANPTSKLFQMSPTSSLNIGSTTCTSTNPQGTFYNGDNNKFWYRPPISLLKGQDNLINILGGNITFNLKDITLPGIYRMEGGNTCLDAPTNLKNTNFRFKVEMFANDTILYTLIGGTVKEYYKGILYPGDNEITWLE